MFDIGFTEIVLVAVIGLLILGPERMPIAVRTVGLWVGKIKRTVGGVQKEIQDELRIDEIRKKADHNRKAIEDRMAELRAETDIMEAPVVAAEESKAEPSKAEPKEPTIGGS
jgi:sec-independent protein translocase protein TatB